MSSNLAQSERKVQAAIRSLQDGRLTSKTQAALASGAAPSTVRHRLLGRAPVLDNDSENPRLTVSQEQHLTQWVRDLQS